MSRKDDGIFIHENDSTSSFLIHSTENLKEGISKPRLMEEKEGSIALASNEESVKNTATSNAEDKRDTVDKRIAKPRSRVIFF